MGSASYAVINTTVQSLSFPETAHKLIIETSQNVVCVTKWLLLLGNNRTEQGVNQMLTT